MFLTKITQRCYARGNGNVVAVADLEGCIGIFFNAMEDFRRVKNGLSVTGYDVYVVGSETEFFRLSKIILPCSFPIHALSRQSN